jgi:hypothetical protein
LSIIGNIIDNHDTFKTLYEAGVMDKVYNILKQKTNQEEVTKNAIWMLALSARIRPEVDSEYVNLSLTIV